MNTNARNSLPFLPYGRQMISDEDIAAVVEVLKSDWLTTGPKVSEFEEALAKFCTVDHAVVLSSGTAALHAITHALGLGPGDEVIVPAMTFVATANCVVFQGARPVFADVDRDTLVLDPGDVERKITKRTKAVIAVDYAGHPCDYDALRELCESKGIRLVADACHSIGGSYKGRPVGSLADISAFSFHPVKNMTTGEGGAITTNDAELAAAVRRFRCHGVTADFRERMRSGSWYYDMVELGYNYRLTDIQCALGLSQLRRLPQWIQRRNELANTYDHLLSEYGLTERVRPLGKAAYEMVHGRHLYVVRVPAADRASVFADLRAEGIGVNVHYLPVHMHSFYRQEFGTGPGLCPVAEAAYEQLITCPLFPAMTDDDVARVVRGFSRAVRLASSSGGVIEPGRIA